MKSIERCGVAILASGGGSTAEAFIRATQEQNLSAEVRLVVCNNPPEKAQVWERIARLNNEFRLDIPVLKINGKTHPDKSGIPVTRGQTGAESEAIFYAAEKHGAQLVTLMGYMKVVSGALVEEYGWQPGYRSIFQAAMINTHPGPLPETADTYGIHTSEKVLALGLTASKHTVHMVAAGVDTGPVIAETLVPVLEADSADSLSQRVQLAEKEQLPIIIDRFLTDQEAYSARI